VKKQIKTPSNSPVQDKAAEIDRFATEKAKRSSDFELDRMGAPKLDPCPGRRKSSLRLWPLNNMPKMAMVKQF